MPNIDTIRPGAFITESVTRAFFLHAKSAGIGKRRLAADVPEINSLVKRHVNDNLNTITNEWQEILAADVPEDALEHFVNTQLNEIAVGALAEYKRQRATA